jgi:hypothetical protein
METDREAVLKIHPDAYLNEDYSGAPSADVAVFRKATKEDWPNNREVQIGNFCGSNEAAWKSAHSRLLVNTPAPHPDLPHQADGDDFPEPHMGVQPEPEDSPELAQAVAPGERLLDKDCKCCGYACRGFLCDYCFRERLMDSGHQCKTKPSSPAQESETIDAIKLRIAMRELKATRDNNAQLRSQLRNWETWGTVEIAIRNPNVDSYMKHWEGRALAAEEKVVELEGRIANALL